MKKVALALILIAACSAFQNKPSLKGNWLFAGGIYNGKKEGAPKEYSLQRKYQDSKFDAYLLEKGQKAQKYQSGNYRIKQDTCAETETYSAQPSKLTNKTVNYHYQLRHDTLVLQGVLPTGMKVEEYWKKQR